jgi:hypothetical protein
VKNHICADFEKKKEECTQEEASNKGTFENNQDQGYLANSFRKVKNSSGSGASATMRLLRASQGTIETADSYRGTHLEAGKLRYICTVASGGSINNGMYKRQ